MILDTSFLVDLMRGELGDFLHKVDGIALRNLLEAEGKLE